MDTSRGVGPGPVARVISAAIFLCTAMSISVFRMISVDFPGQVMGWQDGIAAVASPLVFIGAGILILFRRPRSGYGLGLLGGVLALPLFVRTELSLAPWNSWIFLNQDGSRYFDGFPALALMRILSIALIVIALCTCLLRLLPARWSRRNCALRHRTWSALTIAFFVMVVWFVHSVTPYSVAAFDHPANFEFRILYVQKRGLHFHETTINEYRDGRVWIFRHDRRLFQYQFENRVSLLALGEQSFASLQRARIFVQSQKLWNLRTRPAESLWSWNAEGWYVVLKDSRLLAFTSEYGTTPPEEVTALFQEIEKLPALEERLLGVRDVCVGFCYDPVAALGFSVLQQRTRLLNGTNSGVGGGGGGS